MKKRVLTRILVAVMSLSILLCGCGQQTESQADNIHNSQEVQAADTSIGQESLFKETIFDEVVLGESSVSDVETILEARFLEYEDESITSDEFDFVTSLAGKTTLTDSFYEWNAYYKYILNDSVGSGDKEDYVLTEWTVQLLLNEDSEYREAAECIQNTIEENLLAEYTPIEDYYSDDLVQGEVIYYPVQKMNLNDTDLIKYIMFGKYANCDTEEAKHIIVLSVGVSREDLYQQGEISKLSGGSIKLDEIDEIDVIEMNPAIGSVTENEDIYKYQNIAFFITDDQCRCTSIISLNSETGALKCVSIPRKLYLNIGDKYGQYSRAYGADDVEQAIRTLNTNLDMNIQAFIAIDLKTFSDFVDALGGVWIDVQSIDATNYSEYIMSALEIEEPIVLNEGYQLLNGDQVATYCWYLGTNTVLDSQLSDVFIAIHKQMQTVDEATLQQAINIYMSNVYTSIDTEVISDGMRNIADYNYSEIGGAGFPQEGLRETVIMGSNGSCIVPNDLESNVIWLHQFLFGQQNYEVSSTVREYSLQIKDNVAQYSQ